MKTAQWDKTIQIYTHMHMTQQVLNNWPAKKCVALLSEAASTIEYW